MAFDAIYAKSFIGASEWQRSWYQKAWNISKIKAKKKIRGMINLHTTKQGFFWFSRH